MKPTQAPASDVRLTGELLKSVSRSFYLSLRLLPGGLRGPVSLAYLLARATDTFADTEQVSVGLRLANLKALASAIARAESAPAQDLAKGFVELQADAAEQKLIRLIPNCLRELARVSNFDRSEIQSVLGKITRAQEMDLERFGDRATVQALPSASQLDEYTYLIAGCVGEFWTEMCFHHLPRFAELPPEEMRALGREYGCGLQLINILRDAQADLRAGRCYLPADELAQAGVLPNEIIDRPDAVLPVVEKWLMKAEMGLRSGMKYVNAIGHRRVRVATALPALIGMRTIRDLRAAGTRAFHEKIKIPRSAVRGILARAALAAGGRDTLQKLFETA